MPQRIQRSTLDSISPNGYVILNTIKNLTAKKKGKSDPFALAAISAVKHEANITTIERKLKASGCSISVPIIMEELNVLTNSCHIVRDQSNLVGKAAKLTFEITDKGIKALSLQSKAAPSSAHNKHTNG